MILLELDDKEVVLLRETLASDLSDLGYEIANTDSKDYRDDLKEKQKALKRIVEQLEKA